MKLKLKYVNLVPNAPVSPTGFTFLSESEAIPGYMFVISEDNLEEAGDIFGGGLAESEELLEEDTALWLAEFFDNRTFEMFERSLLDYLGSAQNVINVMSPGSEITENMLNEMLVAAERATEAEQFSDDSDKIKSSDGGGLEDLFSGLEGETHVQTKEEPGKTEVETAFDLGQESDEPEPLDIEGFKEVQEFLRERTERTLFSSFLEVVCSFANDKEVSDNVLAVIYKGLLDSFDIAIGEDEESTLSFYDKIVSKYLEESESE